MSRGISERSRPKVVKISIPGGTLESPAKRTSKPAGMTPTIVDEAAVDAHRLADGGGVAAEAPPPEPVGEHHGPIARASFVGRQECPSERRRDAEDGEEVRGRQREADAFRLALPRQRSRPHPDAGDLRELAAAAADLQDLVAGGGHARLTGLAVARPEHHEPRRIGVRQRRDERGVEDREDRGVRADAERERRHRDDRESRTAAQHAEGVAEILPEGVEPGAGARLAHGLLDLRHAPEIDPRLAARLLRTHPRGLVLVGEDLDRRGDLVLEIPLDAPPPKEVAREAADSSREAHGYVDSRASPIAAATRAHSRVSAASCFWPAFVSV